MKEEALKLADELQKHFNCYNEYSDMIRRLVEELDCAESYIKQYQLQTKPLSDEEIWKIYNITGLGNGMALRFARAIEERHGIK